MRKRLHTTALLLVVLACSSCIHKVDTAGNPVQASPFEKAVTYSTMLAGANDTIASAVIQANQSKLLSVADTDRILHFQSLIADDHQRLSSILNSGVTGAAASADAINRLLTDIGTQAQAMIAVGSLGVKNPQSQRTIADDVQQILNFGPLITKNLQLAGVLK